MRPRRSLLLVFLAACAGVEVRFDPSPSCSYRAERADAPAPSDGGTEHRPPAIGGVDLGQRHGCVASFGQEVICWGDNDLSQLSARADVRAGESWRYDDWAGITNFDVGGAHTCVVTQEPENDVVCWGNNSRGQLGDGGREPRSGVVRVPGTRGAKEVEAGLLHTCAVIEDGGPRVLCWGDNRFGQVGVDDPSCCTAPTLVEGLPDSVELVGIVAGALHTCAVARDGATVDLWCWGDDRYGALGDGEAGGHRARPERVALPSPLGWVAAGAHHTCAILSDGLQVYCWGRNASGELGDATTESRASPGRALSQAVVGIDAGGSFPLAPEGSDSPWSLDGSGHTCVEDQSGQAVWCWGANHSGQLGDGTTADSSVPVRAERSVGTPWDVAAGGAFSCAILLEDDNLWCWGATAHGELGYLGEPALVPVPVTVLR